jgi:hypothetical protein
MRHSRGESGTSGEAARSTAATGTRECTGEIGRTWLQAAAENAAADYAALLRKLPEMNDPGIKGRTSPNTNIAIP